MLSLQLSRNFTSLKAYMLLRANGKRKYRKLIQQNLDQIGYLAELIMNEPSLEITAPVASNVVCFQYSVKGLEDSQTQELNKKILGTLWQTDPFIISDTTTKGRYMLRACNVNHRSERSDFDYLVENVVRIGDELVKEYM